MHRNRHLFLIRVFSVQKYQYVLNAYLYRTNWRQRYFDAHSCYISDIRSFGVTEFLVTVVAQRLLIRWDFCRFLKFYSNN